MSVETSCLSQPAAAPPADEAARLTPSMIAVCAIGCGLSVANIYYAQPLLDAIAADLAIAPAAIGSVVSLTQLGYALGLILVVPLGDRLDPRALAVTQAGLSAAALTVVATARTPAVLFAGMVGVGLLSVVVQVLVAYAAALSDPARRGQVVGTITSGVVVGILGARILAGSLADLGGWRSVYLTSAGLSLALAVALASILPRRRSAPSTESYAATVRSVPRLFLQDPVLRLRGALAFLIFATFSTLWTALVLPLSAEPFRFSHAEIGLFGLAGVAGALAAAGAGRFADRCRGDRTTGLGLAALLIAWAPIALLPISIPALIGGILLLDLAVQAVHVTSQSEIVARHPQARSRLVGGYMTFYSAGSGTGALAATAAYAQAGWAGVCTLGALFSAAAVSVWLAAGDRAAGPD